MRNKILIAIALMLLLIVGSVILVVVSLAEDGKLKNALREAGFEDAFVATRDLKPGDTVSAADIVKKHFEKNNCSVNAILEQSLIEGSKVVQPSRRTRCLE